MLHLLNYSVYGFKETDGFFTHDLSAHVFTFTFIRLLQKTLSATMPQARPLN